MARKLVRRLLFFFVPPLLVAVGTYFLVIHYFATPMAPTLRDRVLFEIAPGTTFTGISKGLAERGLVRASFVIDILSRLGNRDNDKRIRAGEYELSPGMKPSEILSKLISGDILKRKVLVREGATLAEIAQAVGDAGVIPLEEFQNATHDPDLLAKAGVSAGTFEGYLFPNTYFFSKPITAWEVIRTMLEEAESHWPREYSEKAEQLGYSRHEVLTLASIIEKESSNTAEQPIISSVFHNRLRSKTKLQADPTVIYGIKGFDGNLTKTHLEDATNAYNTYVHLGLPPGPIANPGESSIKAALFPEETNYLYFVADGTGKHIFSTTYAEHSEAVSRFQRRKSGPVAEPTPVAKAATP